MTEQQQHPITPPPELVREWAKTCSPYEVPADHIAAQAARWGADEELEACLDQLRRWGIQGVENLRNTRRPKPPSLAEQALEALEQIDGWAVANMNHLSIHDDLVTGVEAVRAALERLQELESNG